MKKDIYHDLSAVALTAGILNYTTLGEGTATKISLGYADLLGYQGGALFVFSAYVGITSSDSTGKITVPFILEESDDHSTWTAVDSSLIIPYNATATGFTVDNTGASAVVPKTYVVQYIGGKRYVRVSSVPANSTVPSSSESTSAVYYNWSVLKHNPYFAGNAFTPSTNQL